MSQNKEQSFYTPHLEWEYSEFPIKINNLEFEKMNWGFDDYTFIEILRTNDFKFKAIIKGYVFGFQNLNQNNFIGKGNIIEGQQIRGKDLDGNIIILKDCHLEDYKTDSINYMYVEGKIHIESLTICQKTLNKSSNFQRLEWFACSEIPFHLHLWNTTRRNSEFENKKIRIGIDEYNDSLQNLIGGSNTKDYTLIDANGNKFIFSLVPEKVLPEKIGGICIEIRENHQAFHENLLHGIKEFISFLMGIQLKHVGYSIIQNQELIEASLFTCNISVSKEAMPPIQFNTKYDWGDFSKLANQYLSEYLNNKNKLALDSALSKYWISKEVPIGANLPILTSALEIIIHNYLKDKEDKQLVYVSKEEYLHLIQNELAIIAEKLDHLPANDKNIILNKIKGAYLKGPNEKQRIFFDEIGLDIGKVEKQAIILRNIMTHSSRDYSDIENAYDDLVLSRGYEVLFHRVFLKLLGYTDYYIDYTLQNCPSKHIHKKAGE